MKSEQLSSYRQTAHPGDVAEIVLLEQMGSLARLSPGSAILGIAAALLVAHTFWNHGPRQYLVLLNVAIATAYGASIALSLLWQFKFRPGSAFSAAIVPRICVSGVLGLVWGSAPIILIPTAGADGKLVVSFVCAGLIAAGPMLAPVLPAALMFSGFIALGSFIGVLLDHGTIADPGAWLILAFGVLISLGTFDLHRRFTDRILANVQLEEQREIIGMLLRDFEEGSSDWLWQTDAAGRLKGVSAHLADAVGRNRDDIEGMELISWRAWGITRDDLAETHFRSLSNSLAGPAAFRDFLLPILAGGEERWLSLTGKPVYGSDGSYRGFRGVGADITAARSSAARIAYLATTDSLTDLPNRTTLGDALTRAQDALSPFALLCLDLDGFKAVNDMLGHAAGDTLLIAAARRMRSCLREGDLLARLGGDEFAIVQADGTATTAELLSRRLTEQLSEPFSVDGRQLSVGASIGIALAPVDGATSEALFKAADLALYGAKNNGRGTWRFFNTDMSLRIQLRSTLQAELRQAISRRELRLYFQPICDIDDGSVIAMEALMRWRHPVHGAVPPSVFIPLAEETGQIIPIGSWALHQACAVAASWATPVRIAVNLSPLQVRDPNLLAIIDAALAASGLPPSRLEVEITESLFLEATDATTACLHALRARGIAIALDDFGTGYSSLSYLRSFPFDKVKIDRAFVCDLADDPNAASIIQAITTMAESLGMVTTVEGVETQEQQWILRDRGCKQAQGFLFSRPLPQSAAELLLRTGRDGRAPACPPSETGQTFRSEPAPLQLA